MIVQPDGPIDAKIVVLGEAPGREEDSEGVPFVGPSGRLLFEQFLARAKIRRDQCLVLNVHWEKPPGLGKWENIPEDQLGKYDRQTRDAICAHERRIIIAVGDHALEWLTGETGITKWRGSLLTSTRLAPYFESSVPWVLPMIHPAAVLRTGGYGDVGKEERSSLHYRALCEFDAKRAKLVVEDSSVRPPERTVTHAANADPDCIFARLRALKDTLSCKDVALAFDIETYNNNIT